MMTADATPEAGTADDRALLEWLSSRDAACPICDYGLRGIPEARCPECAAPLHLEIASVQARHGPWLLAMGSWTLAIGFDGVAGTVFTVGLIVSRPPLSVLYPYIFWATFLTLTIGSAIALQRVYKARSRWFAKPRRTQWRDGAITFACVAVLHLAVGAAIVLVG